MTPSSTGHRTGRLLGAIFGAALCAAVCVCGLTVVARSSQARAATPAATVVAVGAENEYANVIAQVAGRYAAVSAVMSNPNTDPHSFEASPAVAELVSRATLVVQNGVGYDDFMTKIEQAAPSRARTVINVQKLLGLSSKTANPHLWYDPATMPAVAAAVERALRAAEPAHATYFAANLRAFDDSLQPWHALLAKIKQRFRGARVATTEPVGNYLLAAAGADVATPWVLQADIMNGVDPAPQSVSAEEALLSGSDKVRAFLYNRQVTDSLTQSFLALARAHHVAVIGVYETMPTGYTYQSWMLAETKALWRALSSGSSTSAL